VSEAAATYGGQACNWCTVDIEVRFLFSVYIYTGIVPNVICARKQCLIQKNNENENKSRISHTYHVNDKVMLGKGNENKYEAPFTGPHKILKVNTNGTVRLPIGSVTDTINVHRIGPYKESADSIHGGECNMQLSKKRRQAHD
jgi:hypothetical protein